MIRVHVVERDDPAAGTDAAVPLADAGLRFERDPVTNRLKTASKAWSSNTRSLASASWSVTRKPAWSALARATASLPGEASTPVTS